MKHLLLLLSLFLMVNLTAQVDTTYSIFKSENFKTSLVPVTILVGTFTIIEFHGQNMTNKQCSMVAATGMATSIATCFIIKKIRKRIKR